MLKRRKSFQVLNLLLDGCASQIVIHVSLRLKGRTTNPYPIGCQFEVCEFVHTLQSFNLRDLILHKVYVHQSSQVVDSLDVFDFVKAEI